MAKPGRPKSTIQLTTGNDPSLWKYGSLQEALRANISLIASLIAPELMFSDAEGDPTLAADQPAQEEKPRKR